MLDPKRSIAGNYPAPVIGAFRVSMLIALIIMAGIGLVGNQIQHRWYSTDFISFFEMHAEGVGTVDRADWQCETLKSRFTGQLGLGIITIVLFGFMIAMTIASVIYEVHKTRYWYGPDAIERDEQRRVAKAKAEEEALKAREQLKEAEDAARPDGALVNSGFPYQYVPHDPYAFDNESASKEGVPHVADNATTLPNNSNLTVNRGESGTFATGGGNSMNGGISITTSNIYVGSFDDDDEGAEEYHQLMALEAIKAIIDPEEEERKEAFGCFGGPLHISLRILYLIMVVVALGANLVSWGAVVDFYLNEWCTGFIPKNNEYKYGSGFILLVTVFCLQVCVFLILFLEQSARLGQLAVWREQREAKLGVPEIMEAIRKAREPKPIDPKRRRRNRHVLPWSAQIPQQLELFLKSMSEEDLGSFLRDRRSFRDLKAYASFRQHREQSVSHHGDNGDMLAGSVRSMRRGASTRNKITATALNNNNNGVVEDDRFGASVASVDDDMNEMSFAESINDSRDHGDGASLDGSSRNLGRGGGGSTSATNLSGGQRNSTNKNPISGYEDDHPSANASRDPSASPNRRNRNGDGTTEPFPN